MLYNRGKNNNITDDLDLESNLTKKQRTDLRITIRAETNNKLFKLLVLACLTGATCFVLSIIASSYSRRTEYFNDNNHGSKPSSGNLSLGSSSTALAIPAAIPKSTVAPFLPAQGRISPFKEKRIKHRNEVQTAVSPLLAAFTEKDALIASPKTDKLFDDIRAIINERPSKADRNADITDILNFIRQSYGNIETQYPALQQLILRLHLYNDPAAGEEPRAFQYPMVWNWHSVFVDEYCNPLLSSKSGKASEADAIVTMANILKSNRKHPTTALETANQRLEETLADHPHYDETYRAKHKAMYEKVLSELLSPKPNVGRAPRLRNP